VAITVSGDPIIYSEDQLNSMTKSDLNEVIEELENNGVPVDMGAYPKRTNEFLRQAILDHQEILVVKNTPCEDEIDEGDEDVAGGDDGDDDEVIADINELPESYMPPVDWEDMPEDTPEERVEKLYMKHLRRHSDTAGKARYVRLLRGGTKFSFVEKAIKQSDEHQRLELAIAKVEKSK